MSHTNNNGNGRTDDAINANTTEHDHTPGTVTMTMLGEVWWTCNACHYRQPMAPHESIAALLGMAAHLTELPDLADDDILVLSRLSRLNVEAIRLADESEVKNMAAEWGLKLFLQYRNTHLQDSPANTDG